MTAVFQQAIQLIAVALAFGFLERVRRHRRRARRPRTWCGSCLMAIAFMYLAGRVPSMLGHHGTFDAWLHTLYFGMSLPGSMMRSARSLGLLAGGAAGGPAGVAAASAATGGVQSRRPRPPPDAANSAAQNSTAPPPRTAPLPGARGRNDSKHGN